LVHKTKFLKYFLQERIFYYRGNAKKELPLVFIVNKAAQLPALVIALQSNGKAAIIQEESAGDISGGEYRFYIADSVLLSMRRSDLVHADGSTGFIPTLTYSLTGSGSLFNTAKRLINEGFVYTAGPITPPLLPVPNSDKYAAAYARLGAYPSVGYRVLAAAEIYTVIDHFFAYKHLMDKNWEEAYREILPNFLQAKDSIAYLKAVAELNYHINDGHGFVGHPLYHSIINGGTYSSGVFGKMIDGQFVVNVIASDSVAKKAGVKRGDIILEIRGRKPIDLINEVRKFQAASNAASQTYLLSEALLRGNEGEKIAIKVKDAGGKVKSIELTASKTLEREEWSAKMNERLNEPTLRFVTKDIGYADLNKLQITEIDSMFELFRNTRAIIFDMRGYPNGVLWYLAGRLTDKKNVAGAIFKTPLNLAPNLNALNELADRQVWVTEKQMISSVTKWIYKGKTVMLMDESSLSQPEHTGLFLKAANGTKFIGSATAGANGTAFSYPIPGGIWMGYTGHQASHADGKQMQRIGLKPDVVSYPTIKGIQAGKDEVLERAVKYLQTAK
jgi:C-terminal processing protease CtpA/Prc